MHRCNTGRARPNRFNDLLSSDDEGPEIPTDWNKTLEDHDESIVHTLYVPGLNPPPPHPKLSALTQPQQHKLLKVLCFSNSHVLAQITFERPNCIDFILFDILRNVYKKEIIEYIEWAKTIWVSQHRGRVLWPKPAVETTYEAEFIMRAHRLDGFPTNFDMTAQIPLECEKKYKYVVQLKETLIPVNLRDLPEVDIPELLDQSTNIMRACTVPEPCQTHPCQFILPNENKLSTLPISEIHRKLAQFAAEKGTRFIASENALRCLVQYNRYWTIPISVCQAITPDGERRNVVVLDSEFSINKEPAMMRTYRAFKHLLEDTLIPHKERERVKQKFLSKKDTAFMATDNADSTVSNIDDVNSQLKVLTLSEDDNDDSKICQRSKRKIAEGVSPPKEPEQNNANDQMNFVINEDEINSAKPIKKPQEFNITDDSDMASTSHASNEDVVIGGLIADTMQDISGVNSQTCIGTPYKMAPPRSFVKWGIKNCTTAESVDVIVHCAHKARTIDSEIILEPIPEYQLELGGSKHQPDRIRAIILALLLRPNASVLNVRLDGSNGEMVRLDKYSAEQFLQGYKNKKRQQVVNALHTALSKLQDLEPGHYILKHDAAHDANALLYKSQSHADGLKLLFNMVDSLELAEADEVMILNSAPTLTPVLLPMHKHLEKLPCTFTTDEEMVIKEMKKKDVKDKNGGPSNQQKNKCSKKKTRSEK